jgi:hypothetical protein
VTLSDRSVFDRIEAELLPALLPGRATAVCRTHYDVIRYEEGDFFAAHRDYARVRATSVVQHFGLYSLARESCEGGATGIEGTWYDAPTQPDGGLVCPAELLHEAVPVTRGAKLVLKFDFLLMEEEASPSPAVESPEQVVLLADGTRRSLGRRLLERVPFFRAALRFPRLEGEPLALRGLEAAELERLLEYLRGNRVPSEPEQLLETMQALSMDEAAAAPAWIRFLAGAPVLLPEEAVEPLWHVAEERAVPFLAVVARIDDSKRLVAAAAALPSGAACDLLPSSGARTVFQGCSALSARETAEAAVRQLARIVSKATGDESLEDDEPDRKECLCRRAPLLLEMLRKEAADEAAAEQVQRSVREVEYCNDGDYDVFWGYETVSVSFRFGLFREDPMAAQ